MKSLFQRGSARVDRVIEETGALLWVIAVVLTLCCGAHSALGAFQRQQETRRQQETGQPPATLVIVQEGDCLWRIARRFRHEGEDTRRVVAAICAGNGIRPGEILHPGDRLFIPETPTPRPGNQAQARASR